MTDWKEGDPLPNAAAAQIDPAKFDRYSMDPTNPNSKDKPDAFRAIGYEVDSEGGRRMGAQDVINQIRQELLSTPAVASERPQIAEPRFMVQIKIIGPNKRSGTLITVWQIDKGQDAPRLITNYLKV